ncbi:MAG TPA: hypothetical protein EYP80_02035 [Candidatus Aenigmarchaeota archaeon]|nr:hypothetical protein [Candidatus Aenigmarchaeota archaeon]
MTTIADVKERLPLKDLEDTVIAIHLKRSQRDFRGKTFEADDNNFDEIEAVSCKAIYYLAPLLWQKVQQRANEYDETLQTFGDLEVFQNYWLDRSDSIPVTNTESGETSQGGIKWAAV